MGSHEAGEYLEGRAPRVRVSAGAIASSGRAVLVKLYGWLRSAAMAEHGPPWGGFWRDALRVSG